jgi:hypothetical protein
MPTLLFAILIAELEGEFGGSLFNRVIYIGGGMLQGFEYPFGFFAYTDGCGDLF